MSSGRDPRNPIGERHPCIYRHEKTNQLYVRIQGYHETPRGDEYVNVFVPVEMGASVRDAEDLRDRMKRDLKAGRWVLDRYLDASVRSKTLWDAMVTLIEDKDDLDRHPDTIKQDYDYAERWRYDLGQLNAGEVDWYDVREWWRRLQEEEDSPSVCNKALKRLRAAMERAKEMGLRSNNPAAEIMTLPEPEPYRPDRALEARDYDAILMELVRFELDKLKRIMGVHPNRQRYSAQYMGQHVHAILMGVLGFRGKNACQITRDEIDFERLEISYIEKKDGAKSGTRTRRHVIPISQRLATILENHLFLLDHFGPDKAQGSRWVLPSMDGSQADPSQRFRYAWEKSVRGAGLPLGRKEGGFTPHHLKGFGTRQMYEIGGGRYFEVMEIVGHKTIDAHKRYLRAGQRRLRSIAEHSQSAALDKAGELHKDSVVSKRSASNGGDNE